MRRILLAVILLALAAPFAAAATDAPAALQAPASCHVEPEAEAPAAIDGEDSEELPFLDLDTPKPAPVCKSGWCSNDEQCIQWHGPGWSCFKAQGASCGQCQSIA